MKFDNPDSITALKQAQSREQEAFQLYEECYAKAANESTRVVLAILVEEEKKHYEIVTGMVNDAEAGREASVTAGETSSAQDIIASSFTHAAMADFNAEHATITATLEQAVENEKESFNLYSSLAESAENTETAAVFRYLAGEENKHFNMVTNMLDFIGDPGKWLYEEENLIFRRG